jgi:hypothetical protein
VKRASVAAGAGLLVVAAILATYRPDTWPDPTRVPRSTARDAETNRDDAGADDPAVEPVSAPSAPPQRTPDSVAPADDSARSVEFDLRGPDDEPLERGVVSFEGERPHDRGAPAPRVVQRDWRRASPRLALPAWTAWIRAEADSVDDDLVNFDLASDPIELEPSARDDRPTALRLLRRPGIFGRVRGPVETTPCSVLCRPKRPSDAPPFDSEEINSAWGTQATVSRRADGVASYSIVDREPAVYLVALADESGALSPVAEVAVTDRMVRVDLEIGPDERSSLRVRVAGLPDAELAQLEFEWIDSLSPGGRWCEMNRVRADDGTFRVAPTSLEQRATMRRLLAGTLASNDRCSVAVLREGEVAAAQPLANGQREATFTLDGEASLTVRMKLGGTNEARRRLELAPVAALELLSRAPSERDDAGADATTRTCTFRHRTPGDFVLQVWAPLASSLHHGEVWWPIERRALTLHAGDQELALEPTLLHPLTVRFDRARFGADARVQLMLHGFEKWPRYAAPDERGVARFDDVPAGDCTVAVIGDAAGQVDCKVPETSELTVEPTRRER